MGIGVVLFLWMFIDWAVFGRFALEWLLSLGFIAHVVTTSPFVVGIIYGGYWLQQSDLTPERHLRIWKWFLGGLIVFLGINLVIMVGFPLPESTFSDYAGWGRFAIALGAAVGLLIGIIEARAIERERAIERAIVRAEELAYRNDQLEFFSSILRHDVLNGMTVVRGRTEFIVDETTDEEARKHAETALRWSDDVVNIVQRVRTILQALAAEDEAPLSPVDLSAAIAEEVTRVQSTYPEVTFETHVPEGTLVTADELLSEVVGNVLTNAVEHNDPDGLRVTVTVEEDERAGTVTIRIADTGKGVPDDRKDAVFRRGETGHVKETGGGFGLFFVDAMVNAYGGSVRVEDTDPQGAVFVLELPCAEASATRTATPEPVATP